MKLRKGYLEFTGKVVSIDKSPLPQIYISVIEGEGLQAKLDLVKDLLIFEEGDEVNVVLSGKLPAYEEGKDLVLWGYVMSRKEEGEGKAKAYKLLVSLWGFLLVLKSRKDLSKYFNIMDRVYLKISKPTKA